MLQKFPFGDTLLKDLGILQPENTASYPVDTIVKLAKRFPQIGLSESETLEHVREEFMDFCLSAMDIPSPAEYAAADGTLKPREASFWFEVGKLRTFDGH